MPCQRRIQQRNVRFEFQFELQKDRKAGIFLLQSCQTDVYWVADTVASRKPSFRIGTK